MWCVCTLIIVRLQQKRSIVLDDTELVGIVAADLSFLHAEWDEEVDDHSLRRSSTILRRLLVEGVLQRAWKAAGLDKEPSITASTLEPILNRFPLDKLTFAAAGGARYRGAELRGALIANYAFSPDEVRKGFEDGLPSATTGLRAFTEAPCIVVNGELVSRRILVQYVANKLGGAHLDQTRGATAKERLYRLLDQARREIMLLDKPAVYFEVLSMGQALVASPDIESFRCAAEETGAT